MIKEKTSKTPIREEVDKKNFFLSVINGALFRAGFEYVNAFTIVSVFIHTLTGSVALAGLSQFVQPFFEQLGRVLSAPKIHTIKNQPIFMGKSIIIARFMWAVLAVMLLLDMNQNVLIFVLFATIAVSWYLGGVIWPVFDDHLVRTIRPRRRSELLGQREFWGGLAAFIGSFMVKQFLGSGMQTNIKYGLIFLFGFIFLTGSGIPLLAMKDIDYRVNDNPVPLTRILRNIKKIIKEERNFKWYLAMRSIWIITDSALFLSLIALKEIGNLGDLVVSYLIIAQITGRIIGGILWGKAAKKNGSRNSVIVIQIFNILTAAAMIAIVSSGCVSSLIYITISFIVGIITPSVMLNFVYFSETTHMTKRPVFMTIEGIVSMPLAFVSFLFGVWAEKEGFVPIYSILIAGAFAILTIAVFKLLKKHEISQEN